MRAGASPRVRVEAACQRLGRAAFVERCTRLLAGGDESPDFISILGGEHAQSARGAHPEHQRYWLRVWAARGLLWAGACDEQATEALRAALRDEHWRVREMACKVAARHRLGELLEELAPLSGDPVARVRAAAGRATIRIVEAEA